MLPSPAKVLIVDDMSTMRKYVRQCLSGFGIDNVTEADDGDTAWQAVEEAFKSGTPFDFIITDWNMPRMQGIDLLRLVRSDERTHALPVLMLTGEGSQHQIIEAIQAGASAYLVKPFTPENLSDRVEIAARTALNS
jgi:two-component system chemotaxis response regulator CheY